MFEDPGSRVENTIVKPNAEMWYYGVCEGYQNRRTHKCKIRLWGDSRNGEWEYGEWGM